MKTKLLLISISTITFFSVTNCQEKKVDRQPNQKIIENKMETSEIKKILINQVETGASSEYWGDAFGKEDLDALVTIEDTILKNNGYKTPENEIFNQKIKAIFGRIIDDNSQNQYLKIDTYSYSKCNKDLEFYPYSADAQYLYVYKKGKFITYFYALPQILDYISLFPEIKKYEEKSYTINTADGDLELLRWKDLEDLSKERRFNQQLLISRNKYLFNDDQSQFPWLINNDEYFMESLVTTFGYTEDKKLLKWVMNKNYGEAKDFIKNHVFVKDCRGNLEIRKGILEYIEDNTNENENTYYKALENFGYRVSDNNLFDKNEKTKIIAYIANTLNPLFYKYRQIEGKVLWNPASMLYNLSVSDKNLIPEIKKNNYYKLSNLKQVIDDLEDEAPPLPAY